MKILHTSDWHLGARLNGADREEEQVAVLNEIVNIANSEKPDVVFVCGDIFQDFIATDYADKLLVETLIRLADGGNRAVVVILGNHDVPGRLTANKQFAERENIFLIDSLNYEYGLEIKNRFAVNLVDCGKGYLKFRKDNEYMVVNLMPYTASWFRKEPTLSGEDQVKKMIRLYNAGAVMFEKSTINVSAGHFFIPTEKNKQDIYTEFPAKYLPKAHYTALGHVHDFTIVDDEKSIIYCGSPMQINLKEEENKFVVVATLSNKGVETKEFIKLQSPKKITVINATSYSDCIKKLQNKKDYLVAVSISAQNITPEQIKKIKDANSNIIFFNIIPELKRNVDVMKKKMSPSQVFEAFYKHKNNITPDKALAEMFENAYKGVEE